MNIISYAQNFEDVMLWRALKHVEKGFYIDVGACSPDDFSVTRLFYDHGWTGINIEPSSTLFSDFVKFRVRDINLRIAVADKAGIQQLSVIDDGTSVTGLSTLDESIANMQIKAGFKANTENVDVVTLNDIWKQHIDKEIDVHFLKIDVEGYEKKVILGNDWTAHRPWIVVVEATVPMSQVENYAEWESILTSANYIFAYADGLNRFYVSQEHSELLPAFKYPPNVFDEIVPASIYKLQQRVNKANERNNDSEERVKQLITDLHDSKAYRVQQLTTDLHDSEARVQQLTTDLHDSEARVQQLTTDLHDSEARVQQLTTQAQEVSAALNIVLSSHSWKIMAPYRAVGDLVKELKQTIKKTVKLIIICVMAFVSNHRRLKSLFLKILSHFPMQYAKLKRIYKGQHKEDISIEASFGMPLTVHAQEVYTKLKTIISNPRAVK